jgi:hypothetical protein
VQVGGVGEGKTFHRPDDMRFGPSDWDDKPSQLVCTDIQAAQLMALVEETLVRQR